MTSLHQILPLARTAKGKHAGVITKALHTEQRAPVLTGQTRTYEPYDENGQRFPDERVQVQTTVEELIDHVREFAVPAMDYSATVDATNSVAKADLVVNGVVLARDVPGVALLGMEKFLTDLHTFIDKMPVLDPALAWEYDPNSGSYRSAPVKQLRQDKVPQVIVKYAATDKHPAQTELVTLDRPVGEWTTVRFSGAVSADYKQALERRVSALRDAVVEARGKANETEVVDLRVGDAVFGYVFGPER